MIIKVCYRLCIDGLFIYVRYKVYCKGRCLYDCYMMVMEICIGCSDYMYIIL